MQKGVAFKWPVRAFNSSGDSVTGDAGNITATLYQDGATSGTATTDTNPVEIGTSGTYIFSITSAETDVTNQLILDPVSSAAFQVIPSTALVSIEPENFSYLGVSSGGAVTNVNLTDVCTTNSDMVSEPMTSAATATTIATALTDIKLDHLVAVADADDPVNNSIMAKIVSKSATADWSSYNNTVDSLEAIADKAVAASPKSHSAGSSNDTTGTIDSGTYADTATINSTYWQISPVSPAVGGFGLNVDLVFTVGTGLDRIPASVNIVGHFDAIPVRYVNVWAYNYLNTAWDQLSNTANRMNHSTTDENYQYSLTADHIQTSDGECKIRFTSPSITVGDDLYIDYVSVGSISVAAAGLTADTIQQAVWARSVSGHDEDTLGYNIGTLHVVHGQISSGASATEFTLYDSQGASASDISYPGMIITVEDKTDDHYETRRIISYTGATRTVIVDTAFSFTPVEGDDYYIVNGAYSNVNTTHISGTVQTANDNGADINDILADTGELQTNQGNWLTATGFATPENVTAGTGTIQADIAATDVEIAKIPKSDSNVTWNATALASINAEVDTALNTAIPATPTGDSINDYIQRMKFIITNKMEITEANGNTTIYKDDDVSAYATVAAAYTSDATTTTRKRLE